MGPAFLYQIAPDCQKAFIDAFDELVSLGCCKIALASSLYSFWRSRNTHLSSPWSKDVNKLRRALAKVTIDIMIFNESEAAELVTIQGHPNGLRALPDLLGLYTDILRVERFPRKDLVQSYGPIPCCLYADIATGRFQFPLVAELLEILGYKPNPNRQTKVRDRRQGTDCPADSLARNFNNFRAKHPCFVETLRGDLVEKHHLFNWEGGGYYVRHRHYFDWKHMFPAQKVENRSR
jgi:hypothetical protein